MSTEFVAQSDLTTEALRRRLSAKDAKATILNGANFRHIFAAQTQEQAGRHIDAMLREVLATSGPRRDVNMQKAIDVVETSHDASELQTMVSMFANYKAVLRKAATNPHINEQTQRILMGDAECSKDMVLQRNLASNPALKPTVMVDMLTRSDDRFVRHHLALNAAHQSQLTVVDEPFSRICAEISRDSDSVIAVAAIAGIKDPEVLRGIAAHHDMILGSEFLSEVARNHYSPEDVLERLAKIENLPLGEYSGRIVEVSSRARNTIAWKRHQSEQVTPSYELW